MKEKVVLTVSKVSEAGAHARFFYDINCILEVTTYYGRRTGAVSLAIKLDILYKILILFKRATCQVPFENGA